MDPDGRWACRATTIAVAAWLCFVINQVAAAADKEVYTLRISQADAGAGHAITMVCSRAERPFCLDTFEIATGGRILKVRVVALFSGDRLVERHATQYIATLNADVELRPQLPEGTLTPFDWGRR